MSQLIGDEVIFWMLENWHMNGRGIRTRSMCLSVKPNRAIVLYWDVKLAETGIKGVAVRGGFGMVYGIDLGTTNSLIGHGEKLFTGLVSSNVNVVTKKQVPRDEVGEDIVASYKTDMSIGESGRLSVACSTVVLKELVQRVKNACGDVVRDVVISVPAYFSTSQREAVYKAAGDAGLNVKTLINEPTAAAIYVCRERRDLILVYDLGGGTFDVTIVDSRDGSYSVVATDGVVLGGDDLDSALAQEVVMALRVPIRFRTKKNMRILRSRMRIAKEGIQKKGVRQVQVDIPEFGEGAYYVLDESVYKKCVLEVFGKTITMMENLLHTYLASYEKPKIVFVGGSSSCPYLKGMIRERLGLDEVLCDTSPDYVVAMGVALYAEMVEKGMADKCVYDVTKRLCIEDSYGRTITVIDSGTSVPCKNTITVSNSETSEYLKLKLYQGDSIIASQNEYIGRMDFHYGKVVESGDGIVEVTLEVGVDGIIGLSAVDILQGDDSARKIQLTAR